MSVLVFAATVFFVTGTLLPLFTLDHWVVRLFDFPRVQLSVGMVLTLSGFFLLGPSSVIEYGAVVLLGACLVYQINHILPYTILSPLHVKEASNDTRGTERISFLIANVQMDNRESEALLSLIDEKQPDLVLALETDDWWTEKLDRLREAFPHVLQHPRGNAYGMCLYSKYAFDRSCVRFFVEDDVPSIHTRISVSSDLHVWFHGMHPRPPHPGHEPDTTERDAELLLLAKEIQGREEPTIVGGDLNDVSWSYTTQLFMKISGLLDPRVGRGLYSTFHARYPFLRYPLDHTFHSEHFALSEMEILPYVGSDHFPVFVELQYEPGAEDHQVEPEAEERDEAQAEREIEKLREKRASQ